jgi:phosphoserine phosphatase
MVSALTVDLVMFDMDGVIFQGRNFWLDLHRAMGTEEAAWHLWNTYGQTDYPRLASVTVAEVWCGRSADAFYDLIAARRYVEGVPEVIAWFHEQGVQTAIVSSGPWQLAERAQRELEIDVIRGNRVGIADGVFSGVVDLQVDDARKDVAARAVMAELNVEPMRAAMVGDTAADGRLAGIVGHLIAYDPSDPAFAGTAETVLAAGHLRDLIGCFCPPVGD